MDEERTSTPESEDNARPGRLRVVLGAVRRLWPLGLILVSAFLGVALFNYFYPAPIPSSPEEINQSIAQAMASATPGPAYSAQVYQAILPSLVIIQTEREVAHEEGRFGVGSGVIVNDSADILTALHVVDGASEIEIHFADGSQASAEVISAEPNNDIAVLRPSQPPELIVPAVLGNPGDAGGRRSLCSR